MLRIPFWGTAVGHWRRVRRAGRLNVWSLKKRELVGERGCQLGGMWNLWLSFHPLASLGPWNQQLPVSYSMRDTFVGCLCWTKGVCGRRKNHLSTLSSQQFHYDWSKSFYVWIDWTTLRKMGSSIPPLSTINTSLHCCIFGRYKRKLKSYLMFITSNCCCYSSQLQEGFTIEHKAPQTCNWLHY